MHYLTTYLVLQSMHTPIRIVETRNHSCVYTYWMMFPSLCDCECDAT